MREEDLRENARREHRVIALLGTLQCWVGGWDGIVFQREVLQQVLHLARFKDARVQWLKDDIKPAFPHVQRINYASTSRELASLYAARKPFDLPTTARPVNDEKRIALMQQQSGIHFGVFSLWPEVDDYSVHRRISRMYPLVRDDRGLQERMLHATLGLIAAGLLPLKAAVPPKQDVSE